MNIYAKISGNCVLNSNSICDANMGFDHKLVLINHFCQISIYVNRIDGRVLASVSFKSLRSHSPKLKPQISKLKAH